MEKEYAVFGLGEFGKSVAIHLEESGCEVLAVDIDDEKVQEIADYVTQAVRADVSDPEVVRSFGIKNMDGVIVALSDNLEASIMAIIVAKECGVPYVLAKAKSDIQATVLQKVGADEIIFPERAMGVRTAMSIVSGNLMDVIELSADFSMVEIAAPLGWVGKTLRDLNLRSRLGLNVIVKKKKGVVELNVEPDDILEATDRFIIVGDNKTLEKLK